MNIHRIFNKITCKNQDTSHSEISTTPTIILISICIYTCNFHLTRCGLMSNIGDI